MRTIAAGFVALFVVAAFITVSPPAHAASSRYAGGAKYGPELGEVFGHRGVGHRGARARGEAGRTAYAAPLPNESGAPNGGFFVNGTFYPHTTSENIWRK
jgi:hypothetical protein